MSLRAASSSAFRSACQILSAGQQVTRSVTAAALCCVLVGQPLWAAGVILSPASPGATRPAELQGTPRVLHALNRLTFGPRPGETAAVQQMGLEKWFERQLDPASIDDSALNARLAQFPAMQLSPVELQERFPSPGQIRQMESGRQPLPSDPVQHTLALDQIAFYQAKKSQKENKAMDGTASESRPGKKVRVGLDALDQSATGGPTADGHAEGEWQERADKPIPAADLAQVEASGVVSGYGRSKALTILAEPPAQRVQTILAMPAQELVRFRQSLRPKDVMQMVEGVTPAQKETLLALSGSVRLIAAEEMESRVLRDVYSQRELEAVMTDFWLNHFNVYLRKNQQEPFLIPAYERDAIRPHALGRFEDLLVATAKSPAMLVYLDNYRSTGPNSRAANRIRSVQTMRPNGNSKQQAAAGLNENYGRELMELHTLGVNGGYTQADVTNVAKVFTGWTLDRSAESGGYQFNPNRHEPGSKMVLGRTIHESGENEGLEVLHMLATSPATAKFISEKLAVRFVSDAPPPALVDRMAQSFLSSGGDIRTVLRTMFHAPEFWSTDTEDAKLKTPEEFVFSAARASGLEIGDGLSLVQALDKLGQPVYGLQTPNGYGWRKDDWVGTGALVSRLNFALVLAADRLPGTRTDWSELLGERAVGVQSVKYSPASEREQTAAEKERRLEVILLGQPVSERTRETVLSQAGDQTIAEQAATQLDLSVVGKRGKVERSKRKPGQGTPHGPEDSQAAVIAGLLLGSPEFQRR